MVTIETISILFTGISISLAAFYYINTLRNTRKHQELQLETRQAQLFMQIYDNFSKTEFYRKYTEVIQNMEWKDAEDYERKYGDDLESYSNVDTILLFFEGIGVLVEQGLIDVNLVARLISFNLIHFWEKMGPVYKARRERYGFPYIAEYNEWLYNAVKRVKKDHVPAYLIE